MSIVAAALLFAGTPAFAGDLSLALGAGSTMLNNTVENPRVSFLVQGTYNHNNLLITVRHIRNVRLELDLAFGQGGFKRNADANEWALMTGVRHRSPARTETFIAGGIGWVRGNRDDWIYESNGMPLARVTYSTVGLAGQAGAYYRSIGFVIAFNINSGQSFAGGQLCFRVGGRIGRDTG
jgi:hypothetical protein